MTEKMPTCRVCRRPAPAFHNYNPIIIGGLRDTRICCGCERVITPPPPKGYQKRWMARRLLYRKEAVRLLRGIIRAFDKAEIRPPRGRNVIVPFAICQTCEGMIWSVSAGSVDNDPRYVCPKCGTVEGSPVRPNIGAGRIR